LAFATDKNRFPKPTSDTDKRSPACHLATAGLLFALLLLLLLLLLGLLLLLLVPLWMGLLEVTPEVRLPMSEGEFAFVRFIYNRLIDEGRIGSNPAVQLSSE